MKKKIPGGLKTVLLLAVIQAAAAAAVYFCTVLSLGTVFSAVTPVLTTFLCIAFVAVCAVIAVKKAGAAVTVWFSVMAVVSIVTRIPDTMPSLSWLTTNAILEALGNFTLLPLPLTLFFGGIVSLALPLIIYAALAVTSACVSRKKGRATSTVTAS